LLHFLGMAAISRQSYREARSLLEESQQYHRQMENQQDLVWSSLYLGQVCFAQERSVVRRQARVSSICARSLPRSANVPTTSRQKRRSRRHSATRPLLPPGPRGGR